MSAAPTFARESRWLRLGGMALIIVALPALMFLQEASDPQRLLESGERASGTWIFVAFFVAVNVLALGLVLLLAGLRELSLTTNVQARRGALTRLGAVNLMLLCAGVVALDASGAFGNVFDTEWHRLPVLIAFVIVARKSVRLFRSGWKYEVRTAEEAIAADPRAPVVYLRSFGVDDQIMVTARSLGARLGGLLAYTVSVSPEQEMAFIMERVGPVVAIGKPGERLPELGAARLYVSDDEWRAVVGTLIDDAALVVIRAGETASLWWEIAEAMRRCQPGRVIIVALGPPAMRANFERRFAEAFGTPTAPPRVRYSQVLATIVRLLFPYGNSHGTIIYFRDGRPYEEPLAFRLTWSGIVLMPYRPYRDSLQAAFRRVFLKLDLRWTPRRGLTSAVLLALFGGALGLHHFYMGHKRRAIWYVAFCWLGVPILLGWIDAVRLALLTEAEFQARLKTLDSESEAGSQGVTESKRE